MALSDQEELELLSLERQKSNAGAVPLPQKAAPTTLSGRVGEQFSRPGLGELLSKGAYDIGGAVTDKLAAGGFPSIAPAAGMIANMTVEAAPAVFGGAAGSAASPVLQSAGRRLMQSAVKPTYEDLRTGKAGRAIQTMLETPGANPTRAGMDRLRGMIDDITTQVDSVLGRSLGTVDKAQVASSLQPVISRIEATNPTPNVQRRAVQDIYDEFMTNGLIPRNIPVQQAQELKKGIYRTLGDRKYSLAPFSPTEAAQVAGNKGLATGLREGIEAAVPEVGPLNVAQAPLINALNVGNRRALMDGNKNVVGLLPLTHGGAGLSAMALDHYTLLKALAARGLYSAGQLGGEYGSGAINGMLATQPLFGALSDRK